jgi:hypothetical protein
MGAGLKNQCYVWYGCLHCYLALVNYVWIIKYIPILKRALTFALLGAVHCHDVMETCIYICVIYVNKNH